MQAPSEPLSTFFARLLREAFEARDRQADQLYPPTPEEEALADAWLRASDQDVDHEPAAERPTKPCRARVG